MQKIKFQLPSATRAESSVASSSGTGSIKTPSTDYVRACLLLVQKTRLLANSPPATEQEALIQAATWAEILFETIPLDRLDDVYRRAARDHDSTFPLGHGGMIAAWKSIRAEESALRHDAAIGATLLTNLAAGCEDCFGSGFRFKQHPFDVVKSGYIPCDHSGAAAAPNEYSN